MKAVMTTYHGPTNSSGARIIADDGDGNRACVSVGAIGACLARLHALACVALCEKMGWNGRMQGGSILKNGRSEHHVWVWIDKNSQIRIKPKR